MKKPSPFWKMSACLAAGLALLGGLSAVRAAAPALNGGIVQRPLTPTEIKNYGLTGTTNAQPSGGINTAGLGEPIFVDAMVNAAIAPSNIVGVTWSLATKPAGSQVVLSPGPLGPNVPLYKMADRFDDAGNPVFQLAGRTFFRPDVVGPYTVNATITTVGSGSTNLSMKFTGATYLGVQNCLACHSGNFANVPNMVSFTNTPHATTFTRMIDGGGSDHFSQNCLSCHTLGYDTNTFAVNLGFDDMAKLLNWQFPPVLTNGNWATMPSQLQVLANVQCESCHGPGSQHNYSQGISGNTNAISVSYAAADCAQCHDSLSYYTKSAEWNNSQHAVTTRTPSGPGEEACVKCHTTPGFIGSQSSWSYTNTMYEAIACQACHDPHSYNAISNPYELRVDLNTSVTLADGSVITNGGSGKLCMECHQSRVNASTYAGNPNNAGTRFGPHHGPQTDMLAGVNGYDYGQNIPSSAHAKAVPDTCATCHMQDVLATDPAFSHAGGHTFNMAWAGNSTNAPKEMVAACQACHGSSVTSFDIALKDYDGNGVIEGVQTEVSHLMDKLSTLLPNASGVVDGQVKVPVTAKSWTPAQMEAAFNYQFVLEDKSMGVHNTAYTVGLLKASIANLTDDANHDSLPDAWQVSYFGNMNAPAAAPNAINNASGMPNWMMYALGLAPTATFTVDGSGTVFFNGNNIVNGATNNIAIYTAAEVIFDTKVGTSYQIQSISNLSGNWSNVSTNIPGTGGSISYVTPTRGTAQMFYRVVHTP